MDSYDPMEFDLRRSGYLRGPDHRNADHLSQMEEVDEQSVSRMMQIMLAQKNATAQAAETDGTASPQPQKRASKEGRASSKGSFCGSLRGPDHRTADLRSPALKPQPPPM